MGHLDRSEIEVIRRAYDEFVRANRDTASAAADLYRGLRTQGLSCGDAIAPVRGVVSGTTAESAGVAGELAVVVRERADYPDATRDIWQASRAAEYWCR